MQSAGPSCDRNLRRRAPHRRRHEGHANIFPRDTPTPPEGVHTRILVVEDDPPLARMLLDELTREGFDVDAAADGATALDRARATTPDVIVLDLGLPQLVGTEVCRLLRAESDVPIIILSARATVADRVRGLELGADDYLTKPFSPLELVSRVRALLRRREIDRGQGSSVLSVGGLRLDLGRHEVTVDGAPVRLTPIEVRLLTLLARRPGQVVQRRDMVDQLGVDASLRDQRSTYVHISNLRRKLEKDPAAPRRIVTVPGVGYRLDAV